MIMNIGYNITTQTERDELYKDNRSHIIHQQLEYVKDMSNVNMLKNLRRL